MNPDEALLVFLRGSLGAKRDRLVNFASREKTRAKFLDLLHHELGGLFLESSIVAQLPSTAWVQPALRFKPHEDFGVPVTTLRDAYSEGGQSELVITTDGHHGYWRDERRADSAVFVIAKDGGRAPPIQP